MSRKAWRDSFNRTRERLSEPTVWFPYPALIGFGLVIVLRGHLLTDFNHRLGTRAHVMEWTGQPLGNAGIWLSLHQEKDSLVVITDDHERFAWPLAVEDLSDLKPLINYLHERTRHEAYKAAITLHPDADRSRAVLAVDQTLNYLHIRPVLYALAEAKISNYGFETKHVR